MYNRNNKRESGAKYAGFSFIVQTTTDYVGGAEKALAMKRKQKTPFGVK